MATKASAQNKLDPTRVLMTYEVAIGEAKEIKEVPFVVGVIGDFSGTPDPNQPNVKLKDKNFVDITLRTFDSVMAKTAPRAKFDLKNKLSNNGTTFKANIEFKKFQDFRPEAVVKNLWVAGEDGERRYILNELIEKRAKLAELRSNLAGSDKLGDLLSDVLKSTESMARLSNERSKKD